MNASEVLKGFAMKQVYSYLDTDPEANLPNLLDMLENMTKTVRPSPRRLKGSAPRFLTRTTTGRSW